MKSKVYFLPWKEEVNYINLKSQVFDHVKARQFHDKCILGNMAMKDI